MKAKKEVKKILGIVLLSIFGLGVIYSNLLQPSLALEGNDTKTVDENKECGTLQIQKVAKEDDFVNERHILEGSFFMVYTAPDNLDSFVENLYLEIGEDGYSNVVELPVGTYFLREEGVAVGFLPHTKMIEVTVVKDKKTFMKVECEPIPLNLPIKKMARVSTARYKAGHIYDSQMNAPTQGGRYGWHYMGSQERDVYCIQPSVIYGEGSTYIGSSQRPFYLSEKTVKKLEIINYYATKYKQYDWRLGHSIAQSMIWRVISDEGLASEINDTGSSNTHYYITLDGKRVDKTAEWKEVQANIEKHYTKPSFNTKTYQVDLNTPYQLTDTNSVLSKYDFDKVDGVNITKKGNSVIFTITDARLTNQTIKIPYRFYADSKEGDSLYYRYEYTEDNVYYSGWQICAEFYVSDVLNGYLNLKVNGNGELNIEKESNNPSISDGNDAYTLEGAQYTVYSDEVCEHQVGVLTTDFQGKTSSLILNAGDYWIKETKAPHGYALDTTIHKVKVEAGKRNTFQALEQPQNAQIEILLEKIDSSTKQAKPIVNGSLAEAQFIFKFYAGKYEDDLDPAIQGIKPTRTWIMKTDQNGVIKFKQENKVSGDDFYVSKEKQPTLPLGTVTIQEIKAPIGYHLNPIVFVRKITSSGSLENVHTYKVPIVLENAIHFDIVKYENGSDIAVANVEFIHTLPNGITEILKTDEHGKIELTGLAQGQHKIVEKSTIDGLVVNPHIFEFTINANGSITNNTSSLDDKLMAFETDSQGNGVLTVYNDFADFKVKLNKINHQNQQLAGAVFTLYKDSDCTDVVEELTSDENGTLIFKNLDVNQVYYLQETKAPLGYRLPLNQENQLVTHSIRIKEVSAVKGIFTFEVDGQVYTVSDKIGSVHLEGEPNNYTIDMTLVNQLLMRLPNTGSQMGLVACGICMFLGLGIVLSYIFYQKKAISEGKR